MAHTDPGQAGLAMLTDRAGADNASKAGRCRDGAHSLTAAGALRR